MAYFRTIIKMNNLVKSVLFTGLIMILFSSCVNEKKYEEQEAAEIQQYLTEHPDLNFELKKSGLYYLDVIVGSGSQPKTSDTVFIFYTGYFLNGTEFESNVGKDAFIFPVNEGWVIQGIDEGIMLMKEGGTAKFLIPSSLGYGNYSAWIQPYTPLLFEVFLDSLVAGPEGR
jgi:peptidyl-prolyl cis-trans isomerase A (cyclophilin A)